MGLIDATKAIESIDEIVCSMSVCINSDYCNGMRAMKDMALHAIEKQPTVDAVPVEWIKNHIREQVECDNRTYAMKIKAMLDWYMLKCADGERRTE